MKIVIDTEHLLKERCPTKVAILLAALYYDSYKEDIIKRAVADGYITFNNRSSTTDCTKFVITRAGIEKIESILINSEVVEQNNNVDRYIVLANKLRDLYPAGRKPGTAYQWRDSTAVISLRLKALVKKYNIEFTDEQAINATKKYIESFNGNYTYMQLLKYFIMKNNLTDRAEDASQLLAYIENEGQETIGNFDSGELI